MADDGWFVVSDDGVICKTARFNADGSLTVRQEMYATDAFLKQIADDRAAVAGKSWDTGQVIGRVPLPLYYSSGLAEAAMQKDTRFIRNFWNDPDHKALRIKEGVV